MRTAIIFSGIPQNFTYSVESLMRNLLEVNNADAFILMTHENKRRRAPGSNDNMTPENWDGWAAKCRGMELDNRDVTPEEITKLKEVFGPRLKMLRFAEDMPEYMAYIGQQRQAMMDAVNAYWDHSYNNGLIYPFVNPINVPENGNVRCVVDQYAHVKKCYEFMREYETANLFRYDYVMRVRLDFLCPFPFHIHHHTLNLDKDYVFNCGSMDRDPFLWADEFCWFSKRNVSDSIFLNLDKMGFMGLRRDYKTTHESHDYIFSAETQFAIYLREFKIDYSNVSIYRSSQFTNFNGHDYLNYCFQHHVNIDHEFRVCAKGPSDINEHMEMLKFYASKCEHVTELGTRFGNSTVAFMAAKSKKFISYEVADNVRLDYLKLFDLVDIRLENPQEIEETDLLFIDTDHHVEQCSKELALHAHKVRKYLIFHDVVSFWEKGQGHLSGGGLKYAIEPFMASHPEWKQVERFENNNGLLILERQ